MIQKNKQIPLVIYPYVSVIIPVYNDVESLQSCLECLADQTYSEKSYEIIVENANVQKWFDYLYNKGNLDETVERIIKYYIDFCLRVNEEELEDYLYASAKNESFLSRIKKTLIRQPKELNIEFPYNFNPFKYDTRVNE